MSERTAITILGAGIVGVCCARFVQRAGYAVTLVDKAAPGEGTSFGNMGMLCSTEHALPLASVDVLKQIPQMLTDPRAPLSIRWRYLPKLLPWLVRFIANSNEHTRMKNATALATLMQGTLAAYSRVAEGSEAASLLRRLGSVDVYRNAAAFAKDAEERARIRSLGVTVEELGEDELRQLEPALSRDIKFGVYFPDCGHCVDPFSPDPTDRRRRYRRRWNVHQCRGLGYRNRYRRRAPTDNRYTANRRRGAGRVHGCLVGQTRSRSWFSRALRHRARLSYHLARRRKRRPPSTWRC